ncbi:MtrAB system accessory lipoprotein LpqB [Nocardia paucivorans]|uniref:MtrAB system accessory lipoprotein LpqB n=1 Tax=Nocardia paucivorans TaxID=114259 RepID=UPI0002DF2634|nr:MtrAB system accessory lipoprotein LpqB [Nocardia paucivorans]
MTLPPRHSRWFRLLSTAAVAMVAVVLAAGCASLPESSDPQALGTINPAPAAEGPPPPTPGRDPDLLLRDFLRASADPADRHVAARQYMTEAAATTWDDSASTVIVEKVDTLRESRDENEAIYVLRARKVGELSSDGSYHATDGIIENKIEMTRIDGEWRIDELPDGVVVESSAFTQAYRRQVLYFIRQDTLGDVVPDLRWIATPQDRLAERLLTMLLQGPKPYLAPAVRNYLASPVALRGSITKANGDSVGVGVGVGGVRIDLTGAGGLSERDRELLAAQVVLTLSAADVLGPYVLLADGKPLVERFANGWTVADLGGFGGTARPDDRVGLHALRDGTLVRMGERGVEPAPGYFGSVRNLQSVALSPDGQLVAGVADTGRPPPEPQRVLMVGSYGGNAFPVAEGNSIGTPSWTSDGTAAWAVVDGQRVIRAITDRSTGNVSVQDVDVAELSTTGVSGEELRGPITDLQVSRHGARVAVIADGKVYVAVASRRSDSEYVLTAPLQVAVELSSPAVSVDWFSDDTLIIAAEGNVDPVRTVKIDGSSMSSLTGRNLTPPVRVVAASPDHQYVADSRAVLEYTTSPDGGEPYWREVPGLGEDAVPVLPG